MTIATQQVTMTYAGPPGLAPYHTFSDGTTRNFDFLGIAPDPSDRRYAWGLVHAVQSSSGPDDVATATAIHFGRQCNPNTSQCAP
jgi:hypothetical protein